MCGRSRQRVRALVMVILLLGALGGRAGAQPAPVQPASLPEALARLDSETLAERERAAEFLRDDPAVSLADLQAVLAAGGLSAEQARRVSEIAK
ncbi:MAG TPA: hypothetical protein VD963_00555, partial [Phycisphaerales bacterium]|nr:hypothetical protein [Phycisphaerales bacterium]